jgi:hypothetical protein
MNAVVPDNGIDDPTLRRTYVIAGLTYAPTGGINVKADYVLRSTGSPNPALNINPYPQAQPYFTENGFLNLGVAYNF